MIAHIGLSTLSIYWHFPIMLILVSLVYSATRFETWGAIFLEAWRWGTRMAFFLVVIAGVLYLLALYLG